MARPSHGGSQASERHQCHLTLTRTRRSSPGDTKCIRSIGGHVVAAEGVDRATPAASAPAPNSPLPCPAVHSRPVPTRRRHPRFSARSEVGAGLVEDETIVALDIVVLGEPGGVGGFGCGICRGCRVVSFSVVAAPNDLSRGRRHHGSLASPALHNCRYPPVPGSPPGPGTSTSPFASAHF